MQRSVHFLRAWLRSFGSGTPPEQSVKQTKLYASPALSHIDFLPFAMSVVFPSASGFGTIPK